MAKDVPSTLQEGRLKVASTAFFCLLMCECRIPWATGLCMRILQALSPWCLNTQAELVLHSFKG